jgi:hypothetical protein
LRYNWLLFDPDAVRGAMLNHLSKNESYLVDRIESM